jgi:hypothetical protein
MSWRRKRHQRRVAREERRLALLLTLVQEQHQRLALLLPPSPEALSPSAPPFNPSPGLTLVSPETPRHLQRVKEAETLLATPTEDDLLLGLSPAPSSSPSSES